MLLCIDIGNTEIKWGLFKGPELAGRWRTATNRERTSDDYGVLLRSLLAADGFSLDQVTGCVVSSVVPPLTPSIMEFSLQFLDRVPLVLGPRVDMGITVKTDRPGDVGTDLVVNSLAARELHGAPVIVVGFGTATTFCAVSSSGELAGVAIAPGVGVAAEALARSAACLPRIDLVRPPSALGSDTVHAMRSGLVFGFAGLAEGIVRRFQKEMGVEATVVATGGLASLIAPETDVIQFVEPNLTLQGLRMIYERNRFRLPEDP